MGGARTHNRFAGNPDLEGFVYDPNRVVQRPQPAQQPAPGQGQPGAADAQDAFQRYMDSTGYQFRFDEGMDAITGSAAARGLLDSGATARGLQSFGQNIGSQEFQNYLAQLGGLAGTGIETSMNIGGLGSSAGMSGASAIGQGYGNAANSRAAGQGALWGSMGEGLFGSGASTTTGPGGTVTQTPATEGLWGNVLGMFG